MNEASKPLTTTKVADNAREALAFLKDSGCFYFLDVMQSDLLANLEWGWIAPVGARRNGADFSGNEDARLVERLPLDCGGSTPLSFFFYRASGSSKKESGVEPPQSREAMSQKGEFINQ